MDNKIKHLEMIENVIQRMATNSFQLKGWALTLVALIGSLAGTGKDKRFIVLAFIPIIAFWFLDSYYLQLERKYKALYKNVAVLEENKVDFNMDTSIIEYPSTRDAERICYCKCLFSKTEWTFYVLICAAMVAVIYILKVF